MSVYFHSFKEESRLCQQRMALLGHFDVEYGENHVFHALWNTEVFIKGKYQKCWIFKTISTEWAGDQAWGKMQFSVKWIMENGVSTALIHELKPKPKRRAPYTLLVLNPG